MKWIASFPENRRAGCRPTSGIEMLNDHRTARRRRCSTLPSSPRCAPARSRGRRAAFWPPQGRGRGHHRTGERRRGCAAGLRSCCAAALRPGLGPTRRESAERFAQRHGATAAATAEEALHGADVIVTSAPCRAGRRTSPGVARSRIFPGPSTTTRASLHRLPRHSTCASPTTCRRWTSPAPKAPSRVARFSELCIARRKTPISGSSAPRSAWPSSTSRWQPARPARERTPPRTRDRLDAFHSSIRSWGAPALAAWRGGDCQSAEALARGGALRRYASYSESPLGAVPRSADKRYRPLVEVDDLRLELLPTGVVLLLPCARRAQLPSAPGPSRRARRRTRRTPRRGPPGVDTSPTRGRPKASSPERPAPALPRPRSAAGPPAFARSSTDSTCTWIVSPSFTTSRGCCTCGWTARTRAPPVESREHSRNAPNGCSRTTLPGSFAPSLSCGRAASTGPAPARAGSSAMRSCPSRPSRWQHRARAPSAGLHHVCACANALVGELETCTRPSRPPRSTNAPKSRTEVTLPSSHRAHLQLLRSSTAQGGALSSRRARRERTRSLRDLHHPELSFWPTNCAGSSTKRTSICEAGQKARSPRGRPPARPCSGRSRFPRPAPSTRAPAQHLPAGALGHRARQTACRPRAKARRRRWSRRAGRAARPSRFAARADR